MAAEEQQQQQQQPVPVPEPVPTSATETTRTQNQSSNLSLLSSSTQSSLNGRKRGLEVDVEDDHYALLQTSPYFKMRFAAKQLRTLFLQVLRAPDFQNCDAAREIQEKLKLMQDLCTQKAVENVTMGKCNSGERIQETPRPFAKAVVERRLPTGNNIEKHDCNKISGTYIVGGSSLGWNFIMFQGTKLEYYGRTKEAFRAGK